MIPGRGNLKFKVPVVKEMFRKMKMTREKWPDDATVRCLEFSVKSRSLNGRKISLAMVCIKVTVYKVVYIFTGLA